MNVLSFYLLARDFPRECFPMIFLNLYTESSDTSSCRGVFDIVFNNLLHKLSIRNHFPYLQLMMVERLFLALPWGCLQFVIVIFPDHYHLLFLVVRVSEVKNQANKGNMLTDVIK